VVPVVRMGRPVLVVLLVPVVPCFQSFLAVRSVPSVLVGHLVLLVPGILCRQRFRPVPEVLERLEFPVVPTDLGVPVVLDCRHCHVHLGCPDCPEYLCHPDFQVVPCFLADPAVLAGSTGSLRRLRKLEDGFQADHLVLDVLEHPGCRPDRVHRGFLVGRKDSYSGHCIGTG